MNLQIDVPISLERELKSIFLTTINKAVEEIQQQNAKEWMNLKEGADYAGISYNTLMKYRKEGLRIFEKEGVKRISKTEIDKFLSKHSF